MSNLGFHQVYSLINAIPDALCERAFFEPDLSGSSIETDTPLGAFDVLAFALPFELNYIAVPTLLDRAGIGARRAERGTGRPIVIAGGIAVTANPEPLADFVDAVVMGDAELVVEPILDAVMRFGRFDRDRLLDEFMDIPGVYVPERYMPRYGTTGILEGYEPVDGGPIRLTRVVTPPNNPSVPAHTVVRTRHTEFGDAFLVELTRGCPRGCKFCLASALVPCRFFPIDKVMGAIPDAAESPKIGLVGASVSDYPEIATVVSTLVDRGHSVTMSSLRPDAATEPLLAALARSGRKSVTFAPEVGSDRMAQAVGKRFPDGTVERAVTAAITAGLRNIKLYFMIGLPEETDDDVAGIVDMVRCLAGDMRDLQRSGSAVGSLSITVSFFIPKPLTPFENASMASVPELRRKMRRIVAELRNVPLVTTRGMALRWAVVQAILSRGDRRAGRLLDMLARDGMTLRSAVRRWTEDTPLNAVTGFRPTEFRPWDFIGRSRL